jgi:hypothetical protein
MISVELVQNSFKEFLCMKGFWENPHDNGFPRWRYYHNIAINEQRTEWFGCSCEQLLSDIFLQQAVVRNFGDVLLGLYNNGDKVYDMKHLLHTYPENKEKELFILDDFTLWSKEIYIPFQGRSFLPIVGMNRVESLFQCSDKTAFCGDLYLIFGHTNNENRRKFCYEYILPTNNRYKGEYFVADNLITPYNKCTRYPTDKIITLPDYKLNDVVRPFNKTKQLYKKQELNVYEKELIDKAWHPTRHIDWCLDYHEHKILCS